MRMGDGVGGKKNWSVMSRRTKSSEIWCDMGVRSSDERGTNDKAGRGLAFSSILSGAFSSFSISSSDTLSSFTMGSNSFSACSVAGTLSLSSSLG